MAWPASRVALAFGVPYAVLAYLVLTGSLWGSSLAASAWRRNLWADLLFLAGSVVSLWAVCRIQEVDPRWRAPSATCLAFSIQAITALLAASLAAEESGFTAFDPEPALFYFGAIVVVLIALPGLFVLLVLLGLVAVIAQGRVHRSGAVKSD